MTPRGTARLAVALTSSLAAAIAALFTGSIGIALLATPWMVLLALGLGNRRRPDPTVLIRATPERVVIGDALTLAVDVTAVAGSVRASIRPTAGIAPTPATAVARGDKASLEWLIDGLPWGTHDVGRLDLDITEPYGLVAWRGHISRPTPVRIHPDPGTIRELLSPRHVRPTTGNHPAAAIGRGVEYADLRQYQPGDAMRDINWRVSARSPELWVSQRHSDRATDVVLLLDSFAGSGHDASEVFGLAVQATMAIASHHIAATDRVGLVELGGIVRWVDARPGRHQLHRIVDALLTATQYPNAAEKDLTIIPPRALPPRSFVVALSPLADRRFVDALFVLAARGHDIAVIECPVPGSDVDDETPAMRTGRRLWQAERAARRDRLTTSGVATVEWARDNHIDVVLSELRRRRARVGRVGAR